MLIIILKSVKTKMGDNPLGNIPLGVSQPDADKAGGGPPRTSLVTNIIDGA